MVSVQIGCKFPEEEEKQSPHSPSVVADDEIVEREIRHKDLMEGDKPTEGVFQRKELLREDGRSVSVNRVRGIRKDEEACLIDGRRLVACLYANVGELRQISKSEGTERALCIVDAGTNENPKHAEIYIPLALDPGEEKAVSLEIRAKMLEVFRREKKIFREQEET